MSLAGLQNLVKGLQAFDAHKEFVGIVEDNVQELTEIQKEQLMEGKGVDGQYIRPFYSENPFFKKPGAALRYAQWKQKITPNPQRPLDVPNLFITGYAHESIETKLSGDIFRIEPDNSFGDKVFSEHKNALGLSEEKRVTIATALIMPKYRERFKQLTGLTMSKV